MLMGIKWRFHRRLMVFHGVEGELNGVQWNQMGTYEWNLYCMGFTWIYHRKMVIYGDLVVVEWDFRFDLPSDSEQHSRIPSFGTLSTAHLYSSVINS